MQLTTANVDQFAWGRILLPGDILRVGLSGDEECKNEGNVESHLTTPCQVGRRRVSNVKQAGMERSGERRGGEEWRSRGAADHLKKKKNGKMIAVHTTVHVELPMRIYSLTVDLYRRR